MIHVAGKDTPVVDALCRTLGAAEYEVERIEDDSLGPGAVFERLHRSRGTFVLVDRLNRIGVRPVWDDVSKLVDSAAASGCRKLVFVTSREATDPTVVALRRSGVPYNVLHVPRLLDIQTEAAAQLLTSRKVIVPKQLVAETAGSIVLTDIVTAVLESLSASTDGRSTTVTCADGDGSLLSLMTQLNVDMSLGGLRTLWWRVCGRPKLSVDAHGLLQLDHAPTSHPLDEAADALAS